MNALQIIHRPKPKTSDRKARSHFCLPDVILIVALIAGLSISKGGEAASEPAAAAPAGENQAQGTGGQTIAGPSAPKAVEPGSTVENWTETASPQATTPAAADSTPAKADEGEKTSGPAIKADTGATASIKGDKQQDGGDAPAISKSSETAPTSAAAHKYFRRSERSAVTARIAQPARQTLRSGGGVDYLNRRLRSADAAPFRAPPVIADGRLDPGFGPKRQDRPPLPVKPTTGILERIASAPGAVLKGGKEALYGIIDTPW